MSIYGYYSTAETYDQHFCRRVDGAEDKALDRMLGNLTGIDVLDLGCGTGALLDRHTPRRYLGVDESTAMVTTAIRKHKSLLRTGMEDVIGAVGHPDRRYIIALGDACCRSDAGAGSWIPFIGPMNHQREYDLAVSLYALPYFPQPVWALELAWQKLRPGGELFAILYTSRYRRRRHCLDYSVGTPMRTFTPDEAAHIAHMAGFHGITVEGFRYLPDPVANLLPVRAGAHATLTASRLLPSQLAMALILRAFKPATPQHPNCRSTLIPVFDAADRKLAYP
jgi:SAM-dependent methyltransferase